MDQTRYIARMRNVCIERESKRTKLKVLNNINLTLPAKSIIGIIGPSGCGKTTLLKTLVGLISPKSGHVELAGFVNEEISTKLSPSFIGYMPQEIALNEIWTEQRILQFCGRVYNISQKEIQQRIEALRDAIDLPNSTNLIHFMSGGQKRRISLAMSLLHRPTFLVLDEPTVGSDPISRLKIWKFLEQCRDKYGMTILITTHYIEEVRNADTIAYMYKGHLIRHDSPIRLMEQFGCNELEKVALALCQPYSEASGSSTKTDEPIVEDIFANISGMCVKDQRQPSSFQLIKASLIRISCEKVLNTVNLIFCIWLHFIGLMLISFLQRPPIELSICATGITGQSDNLTMNLIHNLDSSTQLKVLFCDLEEARTKALQNKIIGYLVIGENLGESILQRATVQEDKSDLHPLWRFYGDYGDGVNIRFVERVLYQRTQDFIRDNLRSFNQSRALYDLMDIFPTDGKPIDEIDSRLQARIAPHTLLHYCYELCQGLSLLGLLLDRIDGFFDRQKVMGIKPWHVIIAHFMRSNLTLTPMFVGASFILTYYLQAGVDYYLLQFFLTLTVVSVCANSTGVLLGTISASSSAQMFFLLSYHIALMWFNSMIWPNEAIPYYLQPLIHSFPFDDLEKISVLSFTGKSIPISVGLYFEPLAWTFISIVLSVYIFK
ncbi:ABC transporter G family member 23-like [Brevipalpus obovatus]|uniref:ABC transporter G family member 23-like n=1 Tax=Brevipalpus obovatus TaxID=246614 RepID=UPI003D9ED51C